MTKALASIKQAAESGANLVLFPEIFLNPFFPKHRDLDVSEYLIDIGNSIIRSMQTACKEHELIAVPNVYLREANQRYDASVVIDQDGSIAGISKMIHVTQAPGFWEQDYYDPSDTGYRVFDTDSGQIGIVICFDRHFPESIRSCALQGADIVLVPTANMVGEHEELFEWEMRVAAYQNSVYIAMCNRVGEEGEVAYSGQSILVDPIGNLVHKSGNDEVVDIADYDLGFVATARKQNQYLKQLGT